MCAARLSNGRRIAASIAGYRKRDRKTTRGGRSPGWAQGGDRRFACALGGTLAQTHDLSHNGFSFAWPGFTPQLNLRRAQGAAFFILHSPFCIHFTMWLRPAFQGSMLDVRCWMLDVQSAWFPPTPRCLFPRQMAVESKPLFHPEVLRQQVRAYNLPEQTTAWQPKLQHWAGLIASGRTPFHRPREAGHW